MLVSRGISTRKPQICSLYFSYLNRLDDGEESVFIFEQGIRICTQFIDVFKHSSNYFINVIDVSEF